MIHGNAGLLKIHYLSARSITSNFLAHYVKLIVAFYANYLTIQFWEKRYPETRIGDVIAVRP